MNIDRGGIVLRCCTTVAGLLTLAACAGQDRPPVQGDPLVTTAPPIVVLETNRGSIVLELAPDRAPETVRHFLAHIRSRFYDGVIVHRVEPGFVIQIGGRQPDMAERKSSAFPVANENPTGLLNLRGTVAMARVSDPHSALVDFFVNLVDNAKLDFQDSTVEGWGYTVFGRVTEGMEVVDAIARAPTERRGRLRTVPREPIIIQQAYIRQP